MSASQLFLAVSGIAIFAMLGSVQALYGPLLPGLERSFALEAGSVGVIFTAHGTGALCGILLPSMLRVRIVSDHWLGTASALLVIGAALLAFAPTWAATLTAVFVLAIGFGVHVVRLNGLFVAGFDSRGMTMSQLLNAAFSVGAIAGPLLVGLASERTPRMFTIVAIVAIVLFPISIAADRRARSMSNDAADRPARSHSLPASRWRSNALLAAFATLMCLVVGAENSIAGWMTTLALAQGYSFAGAANLTAAFFGAILAGRLLATAAAHRAQASRLVIGAIAGVVVLLLFSLTPAGALAFAASGFALAPIFSATLVWLGKALPVSDRANTLVIAGALLGSAVFPALVGRVVGALGAGAMPASIACIALAALAVALGIHVARQR